MKSTIQDKTKIVNSVFSDVFENYDLMNDIMSLGIHRIWKEKLIDWMRPLSNKKLIDVASGTGDVVKLFLTKTNGLNEITCVEPNIKMLEKGKQKLKKYKSITWINSMAERIPVKSNSFDYYTISYGIRNVSDINSTLKEAYRVLKPGGRFMCLEFSKVNNEMINFLYKQYSKAIPIIGKFIVGSEKPYEYLIESIDKFYNQEELVKLMKINGFSNIEFRNLTNGISAIHSGWKI
tara:strand:+ start:6886 stop:7590 length:705 start_codon:yes stop_codon:yes gene_type:complete